MLDKICKDIFLDILNYIDSNEIEQILSLSKYFYHNDWLKQYVYYKCASNNVVLHNNNFLIKEDNLNYPEQTKELFEIICSNKYMCIAGGFPTQLYLNRVPNIKSDIDIYILGGLAEEKYKEEIIEYIKTNLCCKEEYKSNLVYHKGYNMIHEFTDLLISLDKIYKIKKCTHFGSYNRSCIFNFIFEKLDYEVQFIFTTRTSPIEIVSNFDNSHNRCCIYKNKLYATPDAEISKKTMTSYFYIDTTIKRYKKAINLGYKIYNFDEKENMKIKTAEDEIDYRIFTVIRPEILIQDPINCIYFQEHWKKMYNIGNNYQSEIIKEINILDYDKYKKDLIFYFAKKKMVSKIIKKTNINNLTIKQIVKLYYDLEYIVEYNSFDKRSYVVCKDIKYMKDIKNILLEITHKAHKYNIPEHILTESKDIIGRDTFFINIKNKFPGIEIADFYINNMWQTYGYQYRDYITIFNNIVYIKNLSTYYNENIKTECELHKNDNTLFGGWSYRRMNSFF